MQRLVEVKEVTPSSPASPVNPIHSKAASPAQSPAEVLQSSPLSPAIGAKHKDFEKGDRVVIVEPRSLHEGEHGEVLYVGHGSRETDYLIRLDKKSHNLAEVTVQVPKGSKLTFLMREKL